MNILELREARESFIAQSIKSKNKCLVCIKPNFPGAEKRNIYTNYASTMIFNEIKNNQYIHEYSHEYDVEGLIFYILLDGDSIEIKKRMIEIEASHPLGRLVDIDVYGPDAKQVSREYFSIERRKCFICDSEAVICVRSRAHTVDEIVKHFKNVVKDFLLGSNDISCIAEFCMINELMRNISLGTVTPNTKGSHNDMDMYTFLNSAHAISKKLSTLNSGHMQSFDTLRAFGLELEKTMFEATSGVNTHKGVIFSFLLIFGGLSNSDSYGELSEEITKLAVHALSDFKASIDSNGLRVYNTHSIKGARGEAVGGYKNAFDSYIDIFKNSEDLDKLFLEIAHRTEDTNIIHRAGIDVYHEFKVKVEECLENPDFVPELEVFCLNNNISAGGSADMISITMLLYLISENFESIKNLMT